MSSKLDWLFWNNCLSEDNFESIKNIYNITYICNKKKPFLVKHFWIWTFFSSVFKWEISCSQIEHKLLEFVLFTKIIEFDKDLDLVELFVGEVFGEVENKLDKKEKGEE